MSDLGNLLDRCDVMYVLCLALICPFRNVCKLPASKIFVKNDEC